MTLHDEIHGEGFEDGIAEGVRLSHESVLRAEARSLARVQAYRFLIRDTVAQVVTLRDSLPAEVRQKLIGVISLLEKLAHAEVPQ